MRRTAIITSPDSTLEQVQAYMPDNYQAREVTVIVIEGEDGGTGALGGWTLDGYVIPRLASGLHHGTEVDIYLIRPIGVCDNGRMP